MKITCRSYNVSNLHSKLTKHLINFQFVVPFQNIICWGHNSLTFRFNLFGNESIGGQDVSIAVATNCGEAIQKQIMSTILKLMAEMEKRTISKEEFSTLQRLLVDSTANTLQVIVEVAFTYYIALSIPF